MKNKANLKYLQVFSRHPSHKYVRNSIVMPKGVKGVVRFGSITEGRTKYDIEINTVQSIENTSNKFKMKKIFKEAEINSPKFYEFEEANSIENFPVLAKLTYRSRGQGMKKINNKQELDAFLATINPQKQNKNPYYFEEFKNYTREYRIHVSILGDYFYTCRKVLKQEFVGTENNWYRNDSNCTWLLEDNPNFNKPQTWDLIVADCVKALKALGLSIGGFDVKVSKDGNWQIIEANSACSFGEVTKVAYKQQLEKLINNQI